MFWRGSPHIWPRTLARPLAVICRPFNHENIVRANRNPRNVMNTSTSGSTLLNTNFLVHEYTVHGDDKEYETPQELLLPHMMQFRNAQDATGGTVVCVRRYPSHGYISYSMTVRSISTNRHDRSSVESGRSWTASNEILHKHFILPQNRIKWNRTQVHCVASYDPVPESPGCYCGTVVSVWRDRSHGHTVAYVTLSISSRA